MTPISTSEVAAMRRQQSAWRWLGPAIAICCATAGYLLAADASRTSVHQISASWKLLGNSPDAHFDSALTLRNEGTVTLSGDWSLYFNSAAKRPGYSVLSNAKLASVGVTPLRHWREALADYLSNRRST